MRKCLKCGAANPEGTGTCYACAQSLDHQDQPSIAEAIRACGYCGAPNNESRPSCYVCGDPMPKAEPSLTGPVPPAMKHTEDDAPYEAWQQGDPAKWQEELRRLRLTPRQAAAKKSGSRWKTLVSTFRTRE